MNFLGCNSLDHVICYEIIGVRNHIKGNLSHAEISYVNVFHFKNISFRVILIEACFWCLFLGCNSLDHVICYEIIGVRNHIKGNLSHAEISYVNVFHFKNISFRVILIEACFWCLKKHTIEQNSIKTVLENLRDFKALTFKP